MSTRAVLARALDLALGLAVVVFAVRVAEHGPPRQLEWGRTRLVRLDAATLERLERLDDRVFITYYVSPREAMPSHLRRLETDVTRLLDSLKRASGGRLDYQVVDPSSDPALEGFAARRKVSPLRVRHVTADAASEQEIWSTLTMAYGPGKPAVIHGVGLEHLPRLQGLLVEQLEQMEAPREPVFAWSAPAGFSKLRAMLEQRGRVLDVDAASGQPLPAEADVLVWLDPRAVDSQALGQLSVFLERGRSAVIAGSVHAPSFDDAAGGEALLLRPSGFSADVLWSSFGLRPETDLVLDGFSVPLESKAGSLDAPFRIRCIANNQDFHGLAFEPNGNLLFVTPTPLLPDGQLAAQTGWGAEILATTSDNTWIQPAAASVPLAAMLPELGTAVAKQPLAVWLRHADPWRGSVIALASSAPFRDELFDIEGVAHTRLAQVLVDTLAASDRLVLARADTDRPERLPALSAAQRTGWRLLCLLALPVVLLGVAWTRRRLGGALTAGALERSTTTRFWVGRALGGLAGLLLLLAAARALPGASSGLDLTSERVNTLHPTTLALAQAATDKQAVHVELFFSAPDRLPPPWRTQLRRLTQLLDELQRAGAQLTWTATYPETLSQPEQERLAAEGIEPVQHVSQSEEVTTVRSVWSNLLLRSGARSELLYFSDTAAFDNLEFRLAFALWRLQTGRQVHVALAADSPRLSAAEAHEYYQTQGLIAPQGKDVYGLARRILEQCDFRVTHVNPRVPQLPADVDALVWLQPRRPATAMLSVLAEYLYRGGSALLAAQHFNVQSQQYSGGDFDFVYWPRPQSPDVELYWFPEMGIQLVREVLFDSVNVPLDVESQIRRSSRRDFQTMRSALPFQVRALAAHFDSQSVITRSLGDQPFLDSSFLRWDGQALADQGLTARTLVSSSPGSWTLDWKGGWIPEELLAGPPSDDAGQPITAGGLSLAVLFEGSFPWPRRAFERPATVVGADGVPRPAGEVAAYPVPEPVAEAAPGRLLFLACSEMFKDERLTQLRPEYRADHLLLNAVAALALDEPLAEVMARRPVARGFERQDGAQRLAWRSFLLLAAPALLLLLAVVRSVWARRRPGHAGAAA